MALWRLDAKVAGSGVTGDLLAHSIDTAEWLNGPIQRVVAHTETFVKQRKHAETGKIEPVTIDDACMFLAVFANGSMGTFESTRYARGRKNYSTFEINGELGSLFSTSKTRTSSSISSTLIPRRARRSRTTSPAGSGSTSPTSSTPT